MVGYDREDLVARRLALDGSDSAGMARARRANSMPELKASGTLQPFEKEYFRKDGSRVPVLVGVASFEERPGTRVSPSSST